MEDKIARYIEAYIGAIDGTIEIIISAGGMMEWTNLADGSTVKFDIVVNNGDIEF